MDLFQDRRIFFNTKRSSLNKSILPQIKYSPNILRKAYEYIPQRDDNSKILLGYQPFSNILVSKQITPNPEQTTLLHSKKKQKPAVRHQYHNFNLRKDLEKKIEDKDGNMPSQKRNSTSLSQRLSIKEVDFYQNQLEDMRLIKGIRFEEPTFTVVKGNNNEDLVRELLLQRKIWRQIKIGEGIPNFKWLFYKDRHNYKKMWSFTQKRIINHFQFNQQVSTKDNLIRNLQIYCQTKNIQLFSITPITFIVDFDDEYCQYNMKQFINYFLKNDPRKGVSKRHNLPYSFANKFHSYMAWQNSQIKKKVNILSKPINSATYYSENSYLWLLKPTGLNRGRGIQIFDSIEQLEKILLEYLILLNRNKIKEKKTRKDSPETESVSTSQRKIASPAQKFKLNSCSFVIQKYVEKPFLIDNRKFDIRVWLLLTQSMNVYFFREGYLRTSAETYSTKDIDNYFIHLTNNAIQKYSSNYGQFENANQLSFRQLNNYLPQDQVQTIWKRIKEISFMTFSSVKRKINSNQRRHCFEIFGLDFFIDRELKVWLIEVNQNPCIQCSSPLLGKFIPRMLNDAFKLTIDLLIERKCEEKFYPVTGYADHQNMWQNLGQLIPNGQYSGK